jgi:hypothetical protein
MVEGQRCIGDRRHRHRPRQRIRLARLGQSPNSVSQQASIAFEQVLQQRAGGANESAEKQAEILIDDYPGTPYAMFATWPPPRSRVDAGDFGRRRRACTEAIDGRRTRGWPARRAAAGAGADRPAAT